MSKGKWLFRKSDYKRAITVAQEAGLAVSAIRMVPDGSIELRIGEQQKPPDDGEATEVVL